MNIKRFFGVLLALCLTAALCACNSGAEKKYIAVIVNLVAVLAYCNRLRQANDSE